MATIKTPRKRKTKTEIEQEFSSLIEESENDKSTISTKTEMAAQIQEGEIRASVSEITVEVLTKKLSDITTEVSHALSGISSKMTAEIHLLKTLRDAVDLERKELEKLHNIDVAVTSLDQLITDYKEQKEVFGKEIEQLKTDGEREKQKHEKEEMEYAEELEKTRCREADDYRYTVELERKKAQEKFLDEWKLKEKENREKQETLENGWKVREAELKSREEELISLRKEVSLFSSRLEAESGKAAKEAIRIGEQKYNQEIALLKRDLASEKELSELKIKQLQELLSYQQAQMVSLQSQVEEAKRQVQDIAVKAIEGASGAKTLAHVNEIAIEQAKNRKPNN